VSLISTLRNFHTDGGLGSGARQLASSSRKHPAMPTRGSQGYGFWCHFSKLLTSDGTDFFPVRSAA
jgi:hypothetical protein